MKEPFSTKIDTDLKDSFKKLSDETLIPQARLLEVAIKDLLKKYGKEVKE